MDTDPEFHSHVNSGRARGTLDVFIAVSLIPSTLRGIEQVLYETQPA